MKYFLHQTAIVDDGALIGDGTKIWHWSHISENAIIGSNCTLGQNVYIGNNVKIGSYSIVGPNVEIGDDTIIHTHVNITGNTKIGKKNEIYPFCSIGTPPQDLKYKGEKNSLIIGDNNKLREYVNINPGTEQGGSITKIGNKNLFMVYCHVAHDCIIDDNIVLANNVQVGGHVSINKHAIVGGSCAIHQFSRIGEFAMIGGMTGVLSDVIPYGLSLGNRNYLTGLNLIGLRRSGISNQDIKKIQSAFDIIFSDDTFRKNIENLGHELKKNKYVDNIVKFINSDKKRPISIPMNNK